MKEKLKTEVTKIKEKLEIDLTDLNNIIKTNEKINKGINGLKKTEEVNIVKTLSYISKINNTLNEINNLFGKLMKINKISFQKEYY